MTLGDFTAFNAYVMALVGPLRFTGGVVVGQASRARLAGRAHRRVAACAA